jgi:hypothetical protein
VHVHGTQDFLLDDFGVLGWHIDEREIVCLFVGCRGRALEVGIPVVAADKGGAVALGQPALGVVRACDFSNFVEI